MTLCNHNCIPCCDFCIHVIYEEFPDIDIYGNDWIIKGGPIGCQLHTDEKHQTIAESCGYCNDFYCINAQKPNQYLIKEEEK